ncbi:hypothetical protein [Tepidibacillus marianensis]|uniref:hypothetical protein n=1 Tax=Tepidibacillus marianensis TaxID=3131995 RepID=UPI0030D62C2F
MAPYPWQRTPFSFSPFFDRPPENHTNQYIKKIIFIKPEVSANETYYDLKMCGTKGLKYLKGLHAFVGKFPIDSQTDFRIHPDIFFVEEDIEVKIHIPIRGKILTKPQVIPWGLNEFMRMRYGQ